MSDFAAYLAAAVLLGFAAYRLVTDRRRTTAYADRAALYGFLICEGLAMALLATATSNLLVRLGVGALAVVLAGEIVRTVAVSFLMQIGRSMLRPPGARRPRSALSVVATALLVQAAMIGTFLAARPRTGRDWSMAVDGVGRVLLSAHDAVFAVYCIWALSGIARGLRRESLRVGPGALRLGTRLMLAAACVGILWAAWTGDDIADVLRSGTQDGSEDTVSNVLGAVCASLVVAGATVTRWGDASAAPLRWYRAYRAYSALGPLWEALHEQIPQIALAERRRRLGAVMPPNTAFALYRRVIEIHDGRLALRPYTPGPAAIAALIGAEPPESPSLGGAADEEALIEAASIAAALANFRSGRRVDRAQDALPVGESRDGGSVDDEAAWLVRVSKAFTGSPLVPGLDGSDASGR